MRFVAKLSLIFLTPALLAGPWLFGAWESWWFWPLAALLFAAVTAFGVYMLDVEPLLTGSSDRLLRRDVAPALLACGVFLIYGAIRLFLTPVYTDAERSVLLFLLPVCVAGMAGFAAGPLGRRILFGLLAVNGLALGLYGIINHQLTGSERVLWMPGYMQYIADDRATGSYYCPNHYAGILELSAALSLGLMLDRGLRAWARLFGGVLLAVCLAGVVVSRSRAGGASLLVMLAAAPFLGMVQWRPRTRRIFQAGLLALVLAGAAAVAWMAQGYRERFQTFPWDDVQRSDRVQMVSGALRAWQTAPVFGIGPGMHQNLWPHFAASADGDREKAIWPTHPNIGWHSYEVHSDWVQLLEEYGIVGLVLFLVALFLVVRLFWRGIRHEEAVWRMADWTPPAQPRFFGVMVAALLAVLVMSLHEVVDFNLQMPATGWVLGAILGLAAAESARATDQ
ncbi:MAG: O-antigen ligase family protein [Kiritimatiellia bacterium]